MASTQAEGANIRVTWTQPNSRGSTITSYSIFIENSVASMILYESDCLGTSNTVLYDSTCLIPFQVLRDEMNLVQNDPIVIQVSATNDYGTSDLSDKNTGGATVQDVPHKPPALSMTRGGLTSQN